MSVEYRGPPSCNIRIRLISLVSRFCLTRNNIQPAIMSEGTRSVPRNRALNKLATWENASWPNSSLRKQQNTHLNLLNQSFESFRWSVDSVGPFSLPSRPFLRLVEPRGSKTIAKPNTIKAKTTQLNNEIARKMASERKVNEGLKNASGFLINSFKQALKTLII